MRLDEAGQSAVDASFPLSVKVQVDVRRLPRRNLACVVAVLCVSWNVGSGQGVVGTRMGRRAIHRLKRSTLGAVAALVACHSTVSSPPDSPAPRPRLTTTSPSPSPSLPEVSLDLGAPPSRCAGTSPRPQSVDPSYGKVIGGDPLWGGFYAKLDAKANAFHAGDAERTELGWRIKVLWLIRPEQTEPVTVEGMHASSGEHLWFEVADQGENTTEPRLDPSHPGAVSEGDWKEFPSYLYFPRAGCYALRARWPGGEWDLGFGFGR